MFGVLFELWGISNKPIRIPQGSPHLHASKFYAISICTTVNIELKFPFTSTMTFLGKTWTHDPVGDLWFSGLHGLRSTFWLALQFSLFGSACIVPYSNRYNKPRWFFEPLPYPCNFIWHTNIGYACGTLSRVCPHSTYMGVYPLVFFFYRGSYCLSLLSWFF